MEIILGKTAGFCNGITRAVEKAEEELQKDLSRVRQQRLRLFPSVDLIQALDMEVIIILRFLYQ